MLDGLRGEDSIAGSAGAKGSFRTSITAGRRTSSRLVRSAQRAIRRGLRPRTKKEPRREASALKEVVAELTLENRLLKKSTIGDGEDQE